MEDYYIYYPGGNTTALVLGDNSQDYIKTTALIMGKNPSIEQVGFLKAPVLQNTDLHLEMMGGEFCGNAARCAAVHYYKSTGKDNVALTVSGFLGVLKAQIQGDNVTLTIPGEFLKSLTFQNYGQVNFSGISYAVFNSAIPSQQREKIVNNFDPAIPAVGIIELKKLVSGTKIVPHVYVRQTQTFISESACASGSLAAALVLWRQEGYPKNFFTAIGQPSGSNYKITINGNKETLIDLMLSGPVKDLSNM